VIYVICASMGKDSTALWAWAKRTGLGPRRIVTQDTGWEFDGTADVPGWRAYMATLVAAFGESLTVIAAPVQFEERTRQHNTFPGVLNRRWCTQELKLAPMREYLDALREETGDDVTVVVGVRAEESAARAKMAEREWSDFYDCEVWRPLISWSLEQVIAEHHAAGVPLNPLYLAGAERVGCWPCIKASKAEIALVARLDPARIDRIRQLEADTGNLMFVIEEPKTRCATCKGKKTRRAFRRVLAARGRMAPCDACKGTGRTPRLLVPYPIDEIVKWAKTERGGRRLALFPEPRGCARWGLCEAPTSGGAA